jgi:guanylate kinase
MEALESRLVGRGTEAVERRQARIEGARHELEQYDLFDFIVENGDVDEACSVLDSIYVAARHRLVHQKPQIDALIQEIRS